MLNALRFAAPPLLVVGGLVLGACLLRNQPPQYMQDVPQGEEAVKKALGEIRKELGDDYRVEQVSDVFFVASNDGVNAFEAYKRTIGRVYGYLTKHYFEKKPEKPLRVFLFKDKETYEGYVKKAYGRDPSTPFGFYMSGERKMVMNIATGTGTLAHELVHPLLAEDFPTVPSWFNEGFASLFEQSTTTREGRMVGLVNWRLPGLKRAMKEKRSITLDELLATDTNAFYGDDKGVNYATARYLCLWLQERDLLLKFYKEFKAKAKEDPSGKASLEKIAGKKLDELDKTWRAWVETLEYP
jgi:hypothetical protein